MSRTKAVTVLFKGDPERGNTKTLEIFRQVCTILGALNITTNFFLYCLFCPAFCRVLVKMLKRTRQAKTVQVNFFVVNNPTTGKIAKAEILHIREQDSGYLYPSSFLKLYKNSCSKIDMNSRQTEEPDYVSITGESPIRKSANEVSKSII